MKILLVSWYFPPFNAIGAVRVGKFARFLHEQGHDVRVICGTPPGLGKTLPLEIPEAAVSRTGWIDVVAPPRAVQKMRKQYLSKPSTGAPNGGQGPVTTAAAPNERPAEERRGIDRWLHELSTLYIHTVATPDGMIGWVPFAVAAGLRLGRTWKPDVIFASGPPFSTFVAADVLSRLLHVPWVAEFRDRWVDDPYFNNWPDWRMRILSAMERRLIARAAGVVTVSPPWASFFSKKFGKPVATVYNGYDPRDFSLADDPGPPLSSDKLTIVYTGVIYAGKRDPSPLFAAIARLGERRAAVRLVFVGTDPEHVVPLAERHGIADVVEVLPPVPYKESLRLQRRADVLLLLQWNDPEEQGNCPAKLFEYMAVLRPIIGIGLETGVPATIIRERQAGVFSNDPAVLAEQLETWVDIKARNGILPARPEITREGLDRDCQFEKLVAYLGATIGPHPAEQAELGRTAARN